MMIVYISIFGGKYSTSEDINKFTTMLKSLGCTIKPIGKYQNKLEVLRIDGDSETIDKKLTRHAGRNPVKSDILLQDVIDGLERCRCAYQRGKFISDELGLSESTFARRCKKIKERYMTSQDEGKKYRMTYWLQKAIDAGEIYFV